MRKSGHRRPKGRGGNKNHNKNSSSSQNNFFTGQIDDLGVYTLVDEKGAILYAKTTRKIARYAGEKYSDNNPMVGNYVQTAIMTLQEPSSPLVLPTMPDTQMKEDGITLADPYEEAIFDEKISQYVEDEYAIENAMSDVYWVIWDQCSDELRCHLQVVDENNYNTFFEKSDSLALLKAIRSAMTGFTRRIYPAVAIHNLMKDFYTYKQGRNMTNQEYYDEFTVLVAVVEDFDGSIGVNHPRLQEEVLQEMAVDKSAPTITETEMAHKIAREQYLATAFLYGADKHRYSLLIHDIENRFYRSREKALYPQTVKDAYRWLNDYKESKQLCY